MYLLHISCWWVVPSLNKSSKSSKYSSPCCPADSIIVNCLKLPASLFVFISSTWTAELCAYPSLILPVLSFQSGSLCWTICHPGTSLSLSLSWLAVSHWGLAGSGSLQHRILSLVILSHFLSVLFVYLVHAENAVGCTNFELWSWAIKIYNFIWLL